MEFEMKSVIQEVSEKCSSKCSECSECGNTDSTKTTINSTSIDPSNLVVLAYRNRSVIEACIMDESTGEILKDRIPVDWRARENKLDYLSVSKISAYEQCPACFYHQYLSEEGAEEDSSNFFTRFGTILHEVVELASKYYSETNVVVNPMTIYDEVWSSHDLTGYENYEEGKKLIEDYFARNPVDKRIDDPLCIEEEWRGELGGCTFGLQIDYAGRFKLDHTRGILKDYKTNRMPFTPSELEGSFQLRVYELVLRRFLHPEIQEWTTGYEMFRYGWQGCPPRTEEDLLSAEQYIANMWEQISHDNTWEEVLNNYCGYRTCRFTCKKYQDYLNNPARYIDAFNLEGVNYEEVDRQREQMASYEKIAKQRKDEAAEILKAAIQKEAEEGKKFSINGSELELYANATQSYRFYDTRNVLLANGKLNLLDDCVSISKAKLDNLVKSSPELRLQLASCMDTRYASAYITKKKHK